MACPQPDLRFPNTRKLEGPAAKPPPFFERRRPRTPLFFSGRSKRVSCGRGRIRSTFARSLSLFLSFLRQQQAARLSLGETTSNDEGKPQAAADPQPGLMAARTLTRLATLHTLHSSIEKRRSQRPGKRRRRLGRRTGSAVLLQAHTHKMTGRRHVPLPLHFPLFSRTPPPHH
jgi:hypothetical protein